MPVANSRYRIKYHTIAVSLTPSHRAVRAELIDSTLPLSNERIAMRAFLGEVFGEVARRRRVEGKEGSEEVSVYLLAGFWGKEEREGGIWREGVCNIGTTSKPGLVILSLYSYTWQCYLWVFSFSKRMDLR